MTAPPQPPAGRRTSPRIVLVHTITFRQARQFVPAVIPIAAATGFRGGTTMIVALVVGVTVLSLLTAALSWWRFSYAVGPTTVVVTKGLLARSVRTVPNDRIRGVEVEAPPLHRVFGLASVAVLTASSQGTVRVPHLETDVAHRVADDLAHRAEQVRDQAT